MVWISQCDNVDSCYYSSGTELHPDITKDSKDTKRRKVVNQCIIIYISNSYYTWFKFDIMLIISKSSKKCKNKNAWYMVAKDGC